MGKWVLICEDAYKRNWIKVQLFVEPTLALLQDGRTAVLGEPGHDPFPKRFGSTGRKAISEGAYRSGFDHYQNIGIDEGRFPGFDGFSADEYLAINPDVAKSAQGRDKEAVAREHFSRVGFSEGRRWTNRL